MIDRGPARPPLQGRRLEGERGLRLHQAVLPAVAPATCRTWSTHVDGLDPKTAQKVDFYARQFVDAMSPSNFLLTNPEVLRKTAETGGENLLKGLNNLLGDLERGKGQLRIKMTDMDAFKVGENIGGHPGQGGVSRTT